MRNGRDEDAIIDDEQVWPLLDRYLSGECAAAEASVVDTWAANPENARSLDLVRRLWQAAEITLPTIDEESELLALQARIAADRRREGMRLLRHSRAPGARRSLSIVTAAAAVVVCVAVLREAGLFDRDANRAPAGARQYATAKAQRAEVMLDDGTRVWLNVDSRLRTDSEYGGRRRDVTLEGEAYFVVHHDRRRPFRVHTRHGVTQVLGTEFGVRAYSDDSASVVVVSSGRVTLRGAPAMAIEQGAAVPLGAGDLGRVHGNGRITVTTGVDIAQLYGWRTGQLRFTGERLDRVTRELERWYDLEIELDDSSLARIPVTASLGNLSADQALAIIAGTLDVTCSRQGRVVRLGHSASTRSLSSPCGALRVPAATPTTPQTR